MQFTRNIKKYRIRHILLMSVKYTLTHLSKHKKGNKKGNKI